MLIDILSSRSVDFVIFIAPKNDQEVKFLKPSSILNQTLKKKHQKNHTCFFDDSFIDIASKEVPTIPSDHTNKERTKFSHKLSGNIKFTPMR